MRATFSSGSGRVAGCMVNEGKITKGCGIRVVRKGKPVHVGVLDSLRRVKENVEEVYFSKDFSLQFKIPVTDAGKL